MSPLLYDSDSWRSTLEMKSLSLNTSSTIWQWIMKGNTGSDITDLECLPYYMTEAHGGQHWKCNHSPWMPPLLYDSDSWMSTLEVKLLSLNVSPAIWQWLTKVTTGSEITVLECLTYSMTEAHEGQHWKLNHCPWMPPPPLLYDNGSWRSTLEVKSLSLNVSPTLWQRLMKVNTGCEINVLLCLPYYMTVAHEGQNWKWNHCTWMSPVLYDRDLRWSTLEVKSLSLNASPTIWQWLMKVNTGSEITVLECLPYYMTEAHESQHWKWNQCHWMSPLPYDSGSWRSTLEVKSLSLNASPTIW